MRILIASSEVIPFAKTGGLADVCGALPIALRKLGHQPFVILPAYRHIRNAGLSIEPTGAEFVVPIGNKPVAGRFLRGQLPGSDVPVYFVDQPAYYDRRELYREDGQDYVDNCERFVFFSRAVLEAIHKLGLRPDVLHCNDWQTGLVPAYLQIEHANSPGCGHIASLMTIHNMAYQGTFWHWDMLLTGLDWRFFNWRQMEFFGQLNLLKTGLVFADAINTVSQRYSEEIQSQPLGCGLEGVLVQRRDVLSGMINGIDTDLWNPLTDPHLPTNYDAGSWRTGKPRCKQALQDEFGLPSLPEVPLIGLIGRLADQKGWDLILRVMQRWVRSTDAQWVILGTGEPKYEQALTELAKEHPQRIGLKIGFSEPLAHRIEAGIDMFLMPSHFEPSGLNQMYSLRYGTVPVVRQTGGLADTVVDATSDNLHAGRANGFSFGPYDSGDLEMTLRRACDMLIHHPETWQRLVTTGMQQDFSWDSSARKYVALYERMVDRKRALVRT